MNDLIQWLINYAYDRNVSIIATRQLLPNTPSQTNVSNRVVVINMNWYNPIEIPFIYAHEISHALCGHVMASPKNEIEANRKAVDLLIRYCQENNIYINNSVEFCEGFGIPLRLGYLIEDWYKVG
ncbi:hypothetical protein [Limosilactobacillus gastricus]|uniref:hypothetical protein n=1 Tax=Limosilactobacillus gastricus TaxID=227942 RepID=UPI00058BAAD5|nr:hypothetical protein [Limosilactobacillus gastricus]